MAHQVLKLLQQKPQQCGAIKHMNLFNKYLILVTFETYNNYLIRFEMKKHYSHSISVCGWCSSSGKLFHSRGPATERSCHQGMFLHEGWYKCRHQQIAVGIDQRFSSELAVVDQVPCRGVMQHPVDIDSQLEVDTLSFRQPTRSSENRSDVVMTPGACNEPSCCILHQLQTLNMLHMHPWKSWIFLSKFNHLKILENRIVHWIWVAGSLTVLELMCQQYF